jgi:valyl-tRNA synthetase
MEDKKFNLAKAYDAKAYEDDIYQAWEKSGLFNPDNLKSKGPAFTISMPPPNATGVLHLGHAAALAYEDLMIRYQRLQGKKTLWLPGTDHAAIATQTKVEKILAKEGTDRHKLGREKFIKRVKDYVADSQDTIRNQIRKMGSSCDWSREAYTFSDDLSKAVNEAFTRMYNDGLIYRGNRIVNWCPRCGSTLADDEVEYIEKKTPFYYFKYGPVVIGTARPETKFSDKVIIVHPDDKRYQDIIDTEFDVEWINSKVKARVIADPIADMEMGSGAMTITPGHSFADFELAQKYELPIEQIINKEGKLTDAAGALAGLPAKEARQKVVQILKKKGLVEKIDEDYVHNLSVCYRCQTPIEPLTSEQWFVAVDKKIPGRKKTLKELAIAAVKSEDIEIVPKRFEKTYYHWMENLHDWCISRQIWWGHRIPVWYKNEEIYVGSEKPKGKEWTQDPDTLDTWFSSSLWTFSTLGWPNKTKDLKNFHPTSVMETGYDIIFFWVARMILMSEYLLDTKPFETVYLHGMVRDKAGKKMSKSLDNGIDPIDMINKFGTDALRLSLVIGSAPGADSRLYEEKIAGYRNFVNKLWNISRFILAQVEQVKPVKKQPAAKTLADKWILSEFNNLIKQTTDDLEKFKFSQAGERLYEFTWSKLADWYLEIAKIEKNKDQILLYILERLLILWHPFTPYVTEVLWQELATKDFIMTADWPKTQKADAKSLKHFGELQELVTQIRNIKAENKIPPTDFVDCYLSSKVLLVKDFAVIAKLGRVTLQASKIQGKKFVTANSQGQINATKAMTDKEKKALEKYIKSMEVKLKNKSFVDKAPAQVIKDNKKRLAEAKNKLASS